MGDNVTVTTVNVQLPLASQTEFLTLLGIGLVAAGRKLRRRSA